MSITVLLISLFLALGVGFFLGQLIGKLKAKTLNSEKENQQHLFEERIGSLKDELETAQTDLRVIREAKEGLGRELVRYQTELANLQLKNEEQKAETTKLQEKFNKEFQVLANKILEEKSSKFTEQNKENLKNILNPLQEKIKLFEDKVDKSQKENISIHAALKEQLRNLKDQNLKITQEAENLTKALKGDSKLQGNWGELVLERVLEKSGLEKDREYSVQQSFTREDGSRVMPDVIIHLPDGKKMIVDSKVSLTDYERYVNADKGDQEAYLKSHVNSLKKHVAQLSDKKYEDLYEMESPDFVLMFVPVEPAFALALQVETDLYSKAFEKNIIIVTPTTLLATLRTIDTMWNNEKHQRNAIEIARQAGALYDKFEGFVTDLTKVGKKMDEAKNEYRGAMNKLVEGRGNLVTSIERIKKMGAKTKKSLPEAIIKRAQEDSNELFDQNQTP
nr:DNA recombination protein RmuC [Sediminicola luteus]